MVHDETIIASLEADFPGWRVWQTTDLGSWWASRRGPDWNREPRTLAADSPEGLRAELHEAQTADCGTAHG